MAIGVKLGLSKVHFPVRALGPGRRIGIWFQGCSIRCPGCMSRDTWAAPRTFATVEALVAKISVWLPEADGITISGGEPFDQPEALAALLAQVHLLSECSILVYSGYPFETLLDKHPQVLAAIDVLISEPFDGTQQQKALLRGSANQQVRCLTERGAALWRLAQAGCEGGLDLIIEADGSVWMAGIPAPGDLGRLGSRLRKAGVQAGTSAGRLGGIP